MHEVKKGRLYRKRKTDGRDCIGKDREVVNVTEKQERFCDEYLIDLNATQAAIRAGYSEKTARAIGQRLLTNVDIQKYIQEQQQSTRKKNGIKRDDIITELKRLGFADINTENIKPADKIKALELITKLLGLDKPETDILYQLDKVLDRIEGNV